VARPASDISERIVTAARDRFLLEGVEGASLRAIARDAGTNLGMVYYYYKTKDELFLAVVEKVYGKLLEEMTQGVADPAIDTRSKIERLYARFGALSDDEIKVVRLLLREAIAGGSRISIIFERFSRGHFMVMGAMLQQGVARAEVRPDLPTFAMMMSTLFLGLIPQVMRRRLADAKVPIDAFLPAPPELATVLTRILLEGLTPRAELADAPEEEKPARAPRRSRKPQ
jgi:AcrR family transcriptional regulator